MRCARGGPESVPKETEWTIVFFYHHRERDEMCERVAALTAQNQSLSQREEELYQQVKRSIALVEQAQLEQTEVGLKCCVSLWLTCLEACFNDVIDTEESLWCWVSVLYSKCFSSESSHLINFAALWAVHVLCDLKSQGRLYSITVLLTLCQWRSLNRRVSAC